MTIQAIITQIILGTANISLICFGIFISVEGTYPIGAHVSTWGALAGFGFVQGLFLWADLK